MYGTFNTVYRVLEMKSGMRYISNKKSRKLSLQFFCFLFTLVVCLLGTLTFLKIQFAISMATFYISPGNWRLFSMCVVANFVLKRLSLETTRECPLDEFRWWNFMILHSARFLAKNQLQSNEITKFCSRSSSKIRRHFSSKVV